MGSSEIRVGFAGNIFHIIMWNWVLLQIGWLSKDFRTVLHDNQTKTHQDFCLVTKVQSLHLYLQPCTVAAKQIFLNIDEDFFIFQILSPTVSFILGRPGIPILGNIVIPSWLWHSPSNPFFSAASFSGRKWFTSTWTAFCWHRARPTDRRWGLVVHPAAPSHTLSFFVYFLFIPVSCRHHPNHFCLFCICSAFFPNNYVFLPPCFKWSRYSSSSPEDSLIPCFPAQSTDHERNSETKQVYNLKAEFRILFT